MLVTGTLTEPPDYRDTYTNLQLKVEAVDSGSGDMPAKGFLLARVPALATYEYGQRVRVRGDLKLRPKTKNSPIGIILRVKTFTRTCPWPT